MQMDRGLDTGDILLMRHTPVGERETAGELFDRLSILGAELLLETIREMEQGTLIPQPQDDAQSCYASMLDKKLAVIDWSRSMREIDCLVRGLNPWPCAYTDCEAGRLKIYLARALDEAPGAEPGTVVVSGAKEGLIVACGEGRLELLEIQAPNAKRMAAKAYLMGKKIEVGSRFGAVE